MNMNGYRFVVVPNPPHKGVWVHHADWGALTADDLQDMKDDVLRVALDHELLDFIEELYDAETDVISIQFKVVAGDEWDRTMAIAGLGHGYYFAYDPNAAEEDA